MLSLKFAIPVYLYFYLYVMLPSMNFYKKEKTGKNICQCVQWNKLHPRITNDETMTKKHLPVYYWKTDEKVERKKKKKHSQLQSFLRCKQRQ